MRILVIHNRYQFHGGEDVVFDGEVTLLKSRGHSCEVYTKTNQDWKSFSWRERATFLIKNFLWNQNTYDDIRKILQDGRFDIVHVHNVFMMISPSVLQACRDARVPVVMTLHNFRILSWDGLTSPTSILRGRFLRVILPANMLKYIWWVYHNFKKTFYTSVNHYVALSRFSRDAFVRAGISKHKISVKPNGLEFDPGPRRVFGKYVFYAGGFHRHKGVDIVYRLARMLPNVGFKVAGEGPLIGKYTRQGLSNVEVVGFCAMPEMIRLLKESAFVIMPSLCHENFPRLIAEAFACGVPVACSNMAPLNEIVSEEAGLLFDPRDINDTALKIQNFYRDEKCLRSKGRVARAVYEKTLSSDQNYQQLMSVYQSVLREQVVSMDENRHET